MAKPGEIGSDDIIVVRKGGAKGIDPRETEITPEPAVAAMHATSRTPEPAPATKQRLPAAPQPVVPRGRAGEGGQAFNAFIQRPLIPEPPATVARKAVPVRLPEPITEGLRNMAFVTRRTQQEIIEEFISRGLEEFWQQRGDRSTDVR